MPIRDYSYMHDAGPTGILLIHGLAGNPSEVRYVANRLIGAGHTVHCCQLAGHGGDEKDLESSRWTDWTAVVEEALHGLRERCQFVVAGGLSMGAVLALNLAASRPASVDALALYSPTFRYDGWAMPWYSFLVRLLKDTPVRHFAGVGDRPPHGIKNERVRGFVMGRMQSCENSEVGPFRTPGEALRQMLDLIDHVRPRLSDIRQPTLIVHPREDDMSSLWNVHMLVQNLGGLAECLILDDCYHMITIDQQRDLVVDKTLRFIDHVTKAVPGQASRSEVRHSLLEARL